MILKVSRSINLNYREALHLWPLRKKLSKLFSFFLSVLLLFYAIPSVILAEAADVAESGESDRVDASFPGKQF